MGMNHMKHTQSKSRETEKYVYVISKLLNTYNYNSRFPEVTKALITSCSQISISFLISETVHMYKKFNF